MNDEAPAPTVQVPVEPFIPLPPYILLCGQDREGNLALAKEIHRINGPDHLPIPTMSGPLFLISAIETADPTRASELLDLPWNKETWDLVDVVDEALARSLGIDWPGKMLAKHAKEGAEGTDGTFVFWDCLEVSRYRPFVEQVGASNCAVVFTGTLRPNPIEGVKTVWLPSTDTSSRIATLRREFA